MTERLSAGLFFLLLALLFMGDGLWPGQSPVCVDPLYSGGGGIPFTEVTPEEFSPHNPYLSDQALVFYPWLHFMSEAVRGGEIPWWSPHSGGGIPFIGNLSSAFFFPTTWLSFLPPDILTVSMGMILGAILRLWLAGFFAFLFLRRLKLGGLAALTGGIGCMLFGYQVVWLFYSLSNVACLIPLCLFLTDRFACRPSAKRGVILAFVMALQFMGGHAETSLALTLAVVLWYVSRATGERRTLPLGKMLWRFTMVGVLALLLCSIQLLPFLEYLRHSQGQFERLNTVFPSLDILSLTTVTGVSLSVSALLLFFVAFRFLRRDRSGLRNLADGTVAGVFVLLGGTALGLLGLREELLLALTPDLFGSPLDSRIGAGLPLVANAGYRGPETYTDVNGGYVGAMALTLALLFLISGRERRLARVFGLLLLLAWVLPGAIEPFNSLLRALPLFDLMAPTRMLPLAGIAISILAAAALHEILTGGSPRYRKALLRLGTTSLVAVLGSGLVAGVLQGSESDVTQEQGPVSWVLTDGDLLEGSTDHVVTHPWIDQRGRGHVEASLRVAVPSGTTSLRVLAGDGTIFVRPTSAEVTTDGGEVEVSLTASRLKGGVYRLVAEAEDSNGKLTRSRPLYWEIDRHPIVDIDSWLRLGAVVLVLFLVLFLASAFPLVAILIPASVLFELLFFGWNYNVFVAEEEVYPDTAITDYLRTEERRWQEDGKGPFRVWPEDVILQPNMHYAYGLQVVRSYDQLENRRFNRFLAEFVGPFTPFTEYNRRTLDYRHPLFALLNTAFVVTSGRLDDIEGFEEVLVDGPGRVYRHHGALPRAFLVGSAVDVRDRSREELLPLDPRTHAFLEAEPPDPLGGDGTAQVTRYGLNEVEVAVQSSGPSLLLLTDNDFPGWEATVNGEQTPILRSHLTFRAVPVPSGASLVVFHYRPQSVFWGGVLGVIGLLLAVLALIRGRSHRG